MDLREKMAMLRMEQGQATEHDEAMIFGAPSEENGIMTTGPIDPIMTTELEEPKKTKKTTKKKKLEEVGKEPMETLGSKTAEKRLLMQVSQQLKQLFEYVSSDGFAVKVANEVVKQMNEELQ